MTRFISPEEYEKLDIQAKSLPYTDFQLREIARMNNIDVSDIHANQLRQYLVIYHYPILDPYLTNIKTSVKLDQTQKALQEIETNKMFLSTDQLRGIASVNAIDVSAVGNEDLKLYLWLFYRYTIERYLDQELRRKKLQDDLENYAKNNDWDSYKKAREELESIPPLPKPLKKIAPITPIFTQPLPIPPITPQSLQLPKYVPILPGKRRYIPPPPLPPSKKRKSYRNPNELIWISENERQSSSPSK